MTLLNLNQADLSDIRLIASDVDGTLTQDGKFSSDFISTLLDLQSAGIKVLLVTGRSAGWVSALVNYLPVAGAIAENGGLFLQPNGQQDLLSSVPNLSRHRILLENTFHHIKQLFPHLYPSADNQFRITDWTFDVNDLSTDDIQAISSQCQQMGWSFTYSNVQCHIKPPHQDKATGLEMVLKTHFPEINSQQVLTVGDSPNDEAMFDPTKFPISVGVANVRHYQDKMLYLPKYFTQAPEFAGFQELAMLLLKNCVTDNSMKTRRSYAG
ncbi:MULTISPECIES: HAD family hydrolase [Pseudanabaena]|uniref:HAD-superfamily hydrolase, subfamily IIB n=2 Tax=Pseudanabaena TaxID=1152 RepID=L8MUB2_9CYAN|nr:MULTISPECIES: HAD family hydrolase [Pseudanabaena]ELS31557.1 HAD-superfamily hydrolase, subfamily IIB [Pseudanabaena biceps PCC 7429]MDG3496189.1 HAD family hydrolase [Pseudanabaena catenata USMAC16]